MVTHNGYLMQLSNTTSNLIIGIIQSDIQRTTDIVSIMSEFGNNEKLYLDLTQYMRKCHDISNLALNHHQTLFEG
jgi:hypothetical protein